MKTAVTVAKRVVRPFSSFYRHTLSKQKIKHILRQGKEVYLEMGSDQKGSNGWLTIDLTKSCDIFWDLRRGIPFPNESISKIYSSHFFEHLTFQEGQILLDKCLRVLISGGTFSICVPNARIYIEAYLKSELDFNKFCRHKPAYNKTTKIDYLNYIAYMDGDHKYMFDEENLLHILELKGMKNVRLREFDPNLDLEKRRFESIYAIGEK